MGKIFKICLIILVLLNFNIVWALNNKNETIVIGGDNYFPPFEYVNERGVYKGFNVDIMRAIAIEMGMDIDIRPMPWFKTILALNQKEIDAIQGMKYSKSRDYMYDFSDPYLVSSQAIFVRYDNRYIVNLEDLEGKRVAIQKNDIALDLIRDKGGIQVIETENQENALEKLLRKEVDAYIGNRLTGLYIIQKNGYTEGVKIVGEEINPQKYCIAVRKGNRDLLKVFNEGLERIKKNGTYDKIYKKWFGEIVYPSHRYIKKIIYISSGIIFLSMLFILLFYRWNHILKMEVEKRTQQLRRESVFKEQIINSIFSGLITFDRKGIILSANTKAVYYLNCTKETLLGRHFAKTEVKDYFYEKDFYEVLKAGKEKINIEKELNIEGENRIFEYNLYPIMDTKKDIYGITLTFKDITSEKIMRDKIIMKDKLESLGRLVAGIAHEIRNPLTSIKTYIELIPYKYNNADFRQKISEDVPMEIERLNTTISNLLEYAKPKEPNKELVDVKDIIMGTVRFFENQINEMGINLYVDMEDNVFINADKQQFKQIIINFLLNSIHALEETENPTIEIYVRSTDSFTEMIIKDNGCGISKKNLKRVFEPFFTTKNKGTGLGMSLSYQLIKENGGDIFIDSEIGEGTRIKMLFPLTCPLNQKV